MGEEPIKKITCWDMEKALRAIKPVKAAGPSEVCTELTSASEKVGKNFANGC